MQIKTKTKITKFNLTNLNPHYTKKENYIIAIHSYFNPIEQRVLTIVDPNYICLNSFKQILIQSSFNADFSYGFKKMLWTEKYTQVNVCSNNVGFVNKVQQTYVNANISVPNSCNIQTTSLQLFKAFPLSFEVVQLKTTEAKAKSMFCPNLVKSYICEKSGEGIVMESIVNWNKFCYENKF